MTNEEKFHQEVLKSLDHWSNKLKSKTKEDFDSLEDYGEWVEGCIINIITAVNNSSYEYYDNILEDKLYESISNLRRDINE